MNKSIFMKRRSFSKVIAACLAISMIFMFSISAAFASETDKTYKYVALGDSVVGGNGLASSYNLFMHGLFMNDVSQYDVEGSYPNVFGGLLTDYIQQQDSSYTVIEKNLGQCGYTSTNLMDALVNGNTDMSTYQTFTIGRYFPTVEYCQSLFRPNTEILRTNVADADLISIGSGLNDISESVIEPLIEDYYEALNDGDDTTNGNPLMAVFRMAFLAKVNGVDTPYDQMLALLQDEENPVTMENITSFIQYVISIPSKMVNSCITNVQNTKKIVEYIEENNENDAQIALVSSYNPFGNSLTCDGVTYDAVKIATEIVKAVIEVYQPELDVTLPDADAIADAAEGEDSATAEASYTQLGTELSELIAMLQQPTELIEATKLDELITNISERLSYVISFGTIGLISTPFFMMINAGLKQIAAGDSNVTYVDIYSIPNENDINPHPDADGHKYIANQLADAMFSKIQLD